MRRCYKLSLNGSETYYAENNGVTCYTTYGNDKTLPISANGHCSLGYSDNFIADSPNNTWHHVYDYHFAITLDGNLRFTLNDSIVTAEKVKTWFTENPTIMILPLKEPTFTPFEDQSIFYKLMAQNEVTHISFVGESENVSPQATIRFPRHEDGALVTTSYCNSKLQEIRNDRLEAEVTTQQTKLAELEEKLSHALFIDSFDASTGILHTKSAE